MVHRMDENIGRVLDCFRSTGEYDNTYIFFMSDNGAEGACYEAREIIRPDVVNHIDKYYDNSLENIGRANSFVWYGNRWAQAATAPSRLNKMFTTQGGCRVPLVLKPALRLNQEVQVGGNRLTDAFCTVMDIVPTMLEYAELNHPTTYKSRPVAKLRGKSWKSFLDSSIVEKTETPWKIHGEDHVTGFEVAGSGALRRGR